MFAAAAGDCCCARDDRQSHRRSRYSSSACRAPAPRWSIGFCRAIPTCLGRRTDRLRAGGETHVRDAVEQGARCETLAASASLDFAALAVRYLDGTRPRTGHTASLHRQDAAELLLCGADPRGISERANHLFAAQCDGHMPQQLPAALRHALPVLRLRVRPARYRSLLHALRRAHRGMAQRIAGGTVHRRSNTKRWSQPGARVASPRGFLRLALARRLFGLPRERRTGCDREFGTSAQPDVHDFSRSLEAIRPRSSTRCARFSTQPASPTDRFVKKRSSRVERYRRPFAVEFLRVAPDATASSSRIAVRRRAPAARSLVNSNAAGCLCLEVEDRHAGAMFAL